MSNSLNDLFDFSMTENLSVEDQELFTTLQSIMRHCIFDESGMTATPEAVNGLKTWMAQLIPDMSADLLNDFSIDENIRVSYDEITYNTLNFGNDNLSQNTTEISEQLQQYMENISEIDISNIRQLLSDHFNEYNSKSVNHLTMEQVSKLNAIKFIELPIEKRIYDICPISTDEFESNDMITICPCNHYFKTSHITTWLTEFSDLCPYCKTQIQ